jgi:hypothetical protein
MTRRVVLGKYNDGVTFGLRVSLQGIDALIDDSDNPGFSFDSEWTDIVQTLAIGLLSYTAYSVDIGFGGGVTALNGYKVNWTNPGYKCFMEARLIQPGGTIRDDYTGLTANSVGPIFIQRDTVFGQADFATGSNIGQFLCIVYNISVPSG